MGTPTYKLDLKNEDKKGIIYSKKRIPSWTDRILYYSKITHAIDPLFYKSDFSCFISDHLPLIGAFRCYIHGSPNKVKKNINNEKNKKKINSSNIGTPNSPTRKLSMRLNQMLSPNVKKDNENNYGFKPPKVD